MSVPKKIELDGAEWKSDEDFYDALAEALSSVEWHGRNGNAFIDTMVYNIHLNEVQPPYRVVITTPPRQLRPFLVDFASWIAEARQDRKSDEVWGDDVDVEVQVL